MESPFLKPDPTLQHQMRRTECTLPAALRDVLYFACYVLIYQTPHKETIRLLWQPNTEQAEDAKNGTASYDSE